MSTAPVSLKYVDDRNPHPLYHRYSGQSHGQPAYIALDAEHANAWADYNAEIGNAIPLTVHHGHVTRWEIRNDLDAGAINSILRDCATLFARIVAGYESVWDGSNNVARYSPDARAAMDDVESVCRSWDADDAPLCDHDCPVCYAD